MGCIVSQPHGSARGSTRPITRLTPVSIEERLLEDNSIATDCWYLTGATASGKTAIAMQLAQRLNAEIISLDSMSIYRAMDIGTAKPTIEERARVPHHLIDIRDPSETYNVSGFRQDALRLIAEIRGRGKDVLFVGGTPLYLKSMLRGLFDGPPADWEFREMIEQEVQQQGIEVLRQRLEQVDPLSAHKLHANDKRRMIRALEVYKITGQPISHLQMEFEEGLDSSQCNVFALHWPRNVLHERIEKRVEAMFEAGLKDEVAAILEKYGQLSQTASKAVGYREVIAQLKEGVDHKTTLDLVISRTRQFARRQETWFRGLSECRWLEMSHDQTSEQMAELIHGLGVK